MEKILKNGCMGCLLVIAVLFLVLFLTFVFSSNRSDSVERQPPFEVITKKGVVKLHLGMPKDSVIMIIGTPDDISSHSTYNTIIEEIKYKVKNDDIADLTFEFEDGKLTKFTQY